MSKRIKSTLCVAFSAMFILFAVLVPAAPAGAADQKTIDSYQSKIDDLNDQIAQNNKVIADYESASASKQKDLNVLTAQVNALQEQINDYSKKIDVLNRSINQLNTQISSTQVQIDNLQVKIGKQQTKIDDTYSLLKKRLRAMYMAGDTSSLEILMGADSFETLLTRLELVKCISQHDTDLINTMEDEIKEFQTMQTTLSAKQTELTTQKQQLETNKTDFVKTQSAIATQKAALDKKVSVMNAELNSINATKKQKQKATQALENQKVVYEDYVDALISGKGSVGNGNHTGNIIWPLPYNNTYVTSPYGWRESTQSYHRGIDISMSSAMNRTIVAAASGNVLFTGYDANGYGNYLILDHGNGLFTVYAHCNQLLVREGQFVAQGNTIALLGNTGHSTGPHVHFEIRVGGNDKYHAVNPLAGYVTVPSDVTYKY